MSMLTCSICEYSTDRRFNMIRHIRKLHNGDAEIVESQIDDSHLIAEIPQNVSPVPQNVSQIPQNVSRVPQNVSHSEQGINTTKLICANCNKSFARKDSLQRHNIICTTIDSLTCPVCNAKFTTRQAKFKHYQKCKEKEKSQQVVPNYDTTSTIPSTCTNIHTNGNIETLNNIQNQQNNNNILVINNFGAENTEHITNDVLDQMLHQVNGFGIANLIGMIHFNRKIPENHNIRLGSKKRKTLRVRQNGRWRIRDNTDVLHTLMQHYRSKLSSRFYDPEFKNNLQHQSDFLHIQQDLLRFNKDCNPSAYYACARKILALIEDLDTYYVNKEIDKTESSENENI